MPHGIAGRCRYKRNIPDKEARKGMRVFDVASGFIIYTRNAVPYRGGWTSNRLGPRVDPRTNGLEP